MNENCPYSDECGILASCDETCCRVKELFDDFYKVEKLYTDARIQIIGLKQQVEDFVSNYKLAHNRYMKYQTKLEKIKDRVQDIKFDDEHNIEIINDILQIIGEEECK